jgi:glyoxylase-like metal-dependent hydrolase (beta-lactamase superfamily II)
LRLLPSDVAQRCSFFEDRPIVPLPRDLAPFESGADVLGDGAILAVPLPGHCPGHWGIVVQERRGLHFLVADAAWSSRAIRENRPPPRLTTALLGDTQACRSTLAALHALRRRNADLLMTPSHCAERAAAEAE